MENIIITATAESLEQVDALLEVGVDRIYVGEEKYGLRLPHTFTLSELSEIADRVHQAGKKVVIALNAIMHQDMMDSIRDYLDFLVTIQADFVTVGDTGVLYVLQKDDYPFLVIYDASTMVTSSRQINFWGEHGANEAVLAREIPSEELFAMSENLAIPSEILVYGATVIHQSKRPLLQNYYNFTRIDDEKGRDRNLFLSEPKRDETHYSIYEDRHGTHIFANNDISLMTKLDELVEHGYRYWKLDGIYSPGESFVEIVKCFAEVRQLLMKGALTAEKAYLLEEKVRKYHPANRGLDTGFYDFDPDDVN